MFEIFNYLDNHKRFWDKVPLEDKILTTEMIIWITFLFRQAAKVSSVIHSDKHIFKACSVDELTVGAAFVTSVLFMNFKGWLASNR